MGGLTHDPLADDTNTATSIYTSLTDAILVGGTGPDEYFFTDPNSGHDRIRDPGGIDTISIAAGIADLDFRRSGTALVIEHEETARSIVIENFFVGGGRIEYLRILDSLGGYRGRYLLRTEDTGTKANEILVGTSGDDVLHGGFGHIVDSHSGEVLGVSSGGDRLFGGAGDDTLNGGFDYNTLEGGMGDDTYVQSYYPDFDNGFRIQKIMHYNTLSEVGSGGSDTLQMAHIAPSQMRFRRSGEDLIILDPGGRTVIESQFNVDPHHRIEM